MMKIEILFWVGWLLLLDACRAAGDKLKLYEFQAGRDFLYFGQAQSEKGARRISALNKK